MRRAFLSNFSRGAGGALAVACLGFAVAGCSSSASRFDFPAFNLTGSDTASNTGPNADYNATAALPVPEESVYSPAYGADPRMARRPLPPPEYSPRPDTAYSSNPRIYAPRATYPETSTAYAPRYGAGQVSGYRVKVAQGDTLSSLSRRYGVPVESIMSANNLPDARLSIGQELVMPGVSGPKVAAAEPQVRKVKTSTIAAPKVTPPAEEEAADTPKQAAKPPAEVKSASSQGASETAEENAQRVASVDRLPAPDPMSGNSFRWPVQGRVIAGFGTRPDGGHNDGIDVAVPQGTSVKAAENGVVAYAGNELKGYGNLVLVRHANNWVSAYANNAELLVKRGEKVRRGQVIAKAGNTGAASQPQVHFELRKGSRPVDPTKYMSNQTANVD
jgi:murein DD-endopeptidase MepM/ murein hydrolase activator NlpD